MTLTSENNLDMAKMNKHAKYVGQRSSSSSGHTDTHTSGRFLYLDH